MTVQHLVDQREQVQSFCLNFATRDAQGELVTYWGRLSFNVRKARAAARDALAGGDGELSQVARWVLEVLDGQPDECEACGGTGELTPDDPPGPGRQALISTGDGLVVGEDGNPRPAIEGERLRGPCLSCGATGDNLRGYLPYVEPTPQERRARARHDGWRAVFSEPSSSADGEPG